MTGGGPRRRGGVSHPRTGASGARTPPANDEAPVPTEPERGLHIGTLGREPDSRLNGWFLCVLIRFDRNVSISLQKYRAASPRT